MLMEQPFQQNSTLPLFQLLLVCAQHFSIQQNLTELRRTWSCGERIHSPSMHMRHLISCVEGCQILRLLGSFRADQSRFPEIHVDVEVVKVVEEVVILHGVLLDARRCRWRWGCWHSCIIQVVASRHRKTTSLAGDRSRWSLASSQGSPCFLQLSLQLCVLRANGVILDAGSGLCNRLRYTRFGRRFRHYYHPSLFRLYAGGG
mmetsp:Transcript_19467/g.36414  ORF Transcript_19467/g.36414 Transcript_19467/m.36414 type:complete len:203 (+) Transcript_19467:298-906(+)